MFEAQLLNASASVYSPWMAREGDNLTATCDVVALGSGGSIDVKVYTKNRDETGDGEDADSNEVLDITRDSVGLASQTWSPSGTVGLKELVRYKFIVTGNWVLFRMLSPVWFDAVEAG